MGRVCPRRLNHRQCRAMGFHRHRPHPGLEQIIEMYYSYALSATSRLTSAYQFIVNPAYNTDRGPVNVFGGRFHPSF